MKNIVTSAHLPKPEQRQSAKEGDIFCIPCEFDEEGYDYVIYCQVDAHIYKFVSFQGNRYEDTVEEFFQNYPSAQKLKKGESITITAN